MTTQDDPYSTIKDRINTNKVNDDKEMLNTLCSAIKAYNKNKKYSKLELELQVSKIDYYRINEDKNKNPDLYSRNVFYNANDIRNVTKYILNAGYKKSSNSTFLRISSKENNDQLKRSFRICIQEAGIPSFCENNYSIYTGDNKNIHYENKFREMKQTYNFTNYDNVRANLKNENDITNSVNYSFLSPGQTLGKQQAKFISDGNWENINKTFRFISRVSFTDDSNIDKSCARIDISTIYQSSNKKWEGVDEKKDKPIYEVEIEALNKDGCSEENIKNSILFALKAVLCGVQDSCLPMKSEEMKTISRAYSVLSDKLVLSSSSSNSSWYDGPQPVTLQQEDVSIVCSPQNSLEGGEEGKKKNKKEKSRGKSNKDKADKGKDSKEYTGSYNITNKADGTRKLLFISNGSTFFVDKQKQIQKTEIDPKYTFEKEDNVDNSILDGELVTLRNGKMQYQVFDIYAYRNQSYLHMIFSDREKLFKGVVATLTGSANISVICKVFRNVDSTGIGKIIELNQLNSNIEEGFENDGMILTPTGQVSGHNNSDKVYKWKSVEQTTIDFKVKVIDTKTNVSLNGTEGLTKQNICELLVSMKEKPIEKACETVYQKTPTEIRDVSDSSNSKNNPVRFQVYGDNGELIEPGIAYFNVDNNNVMLTKVDENGKYQKFMNGDIVECEYSKRENNKDGNWVPIRVRSDKTFPNAYDTAKSNYDFILKPVEISRDLCNDITKDEAVTSNTKDVYYTNVGSRVVTNRNNFHNYIKKGLLMDAINAINNDYSNDLKLIDYGVGKGGDIFKWRDAKKIKFAYGIDYSASNLQDDVNGACARYIRMLKDKKNTNKNLVCMFAQGDCSKSIENGDAFETSEESGKVNRYTDESLTIANLINKSIFETIKKELIPPNFKGVINVFGKGGEREEDRFHIGSSQFAMHYFFKNKDTVQQFIDNLKYTIRVGGYFIGTCYNGTRVLDLLRKQDHYRYKTKSNIKIELVMKSDESDENDEESDEKEENVDSEEEYRRFKDISDLYNKKIGGVSIRVEEKGFKGQEEYLVNFDLFDRLMKINGFNKIENKSVEFSTVYDHDKSKMKSDCIMNNDEEKIISFLNDKFIYKNVGVDSSVPYETVPMPRNNSNKSKDRLDKEEEEEEE